MFTFGYCLDSSISAGMEGPPPPMDSTSRFITRPNSFATSQVLSAIGELSQGMLPSGWRPPKRRTPARPWLAIQSRTSGAVPASSASRMTTAEKISGWRSDESRM
ncbi:hypothetical protein FQZ97_1088060 [compost metagenome]